MEWKLTREPLASLATDAIMVFHKKDEKSTQGVTRKVDEALGFRISSLISEGEVTGELGEVTVLHNWGKIPSNRVIVVGLGNEDKWTLNALKDAIATGARLAAKKGCKSLGIGFPSLLFDRFNTVDVIQAIVEGCEFGSYRYPHYRSKVEKERELTVWIAHESVKESAFEAGIARGSLFAKATNFARTLTQEPPNRLTPVRLAEVAMKIADQKGMTAQILTEKELEKMGMDALLSVAKASGNPPRMIVLQYQGAPESKETLGLIGKGVTFDSGGIQVKTWKGMDEMKDDMAGAAAVLAAMDAIGDLRPHANVIAVIPACENMISGNGYRPGDVIKSFSGKTIEVMHTDAEGRVILADAISYAKRLGATKLVDVATLTGAVVVALGYEVTGMCANDPDWAQEVKTAARIAGERVWEFPMDDIYQRYVKSEIADVKNVSGSEAGVIQGGLFLQVFAEDTPWVHLDIGGTVLFPHEEGCNLKGPTGVMTRTLIQLATQFA